MTIVKNITRKLKAILSADVKGYSFLMAADESFTVKKLEEYRSRMYHHILSNSGRVVDAVGDNLLAEFASAVDAVRCSVDIQNDLRQKNSDLPENKRLEFRMGINIGDVIQRDDRIYGSSVNIASRIEGMADPGGICISRNTYDHVKDKLDFEFKYLGEHQAKNIKEPVRVYRVLLESALPRLNNIEKLELPDKPSIAILPFKNMSDDPEQEYFSDGITEDIITALSRSPWLFVISRNSSFIYRDTKMDTKTVSRELGVRYILEGSVRKSRNRVRVTAQLIDGAMGNHVWAEKYDGELDDIFDLQDKITHQIVATIHTQIQIYVGENSRRAKRPDIVTWDLLARCLKTFYGLTKKNLNTAIGIARKAVESAPTSCDAHWILASALFHQVWLGHASDIDTNISEASALAKKAISLDEYNEYAHWTLGLIYFIQRKHDDAIAELKRVIELNPNCSLGYGSLGTVLSFSGEPDESIRNNEIAIRANPKDPSIFFRYSGIAIAHYIAGRYAQASHWARKSIHRKPNWRIGHAVLAASLAQLKKSDETKEAMDNFLKIIPTETINSLRKVLSFRSQNDLDHIEKGLRMAGLPDS